MQTLFPGSLPQPQPPSRFDRWFKAISRVSLALAVVLWPVFMFQHMTSRETVSQPLVSSPGMVNGVGAAQSGLAAHPVAPFGSYSQRVPAEDPQARVALERLAAYYQTMRSYSDVTEVLYIGDTSLMSQSIPSAYENTKFRFCRGTNHALIEDMTGARTFLGVQNGKEIEVRDSRDGGAPHYSSTSEFSSSTLAGQLHVGSFGMLMVLGQEVAALPTGRFAATFGFNEKVEGTLCRVINVADAQPNYGTGGMGFFYRDYTIFIGVKDGLLRQVRRRQTNGNLVLERVETHSSVQVNPHVPASTWDFKAQDKAN